MKDTVVSAPAQLEAELALGRARKHERLWRAAEGRSGRLDAAGILLLLELIKRLEQDRS